MKNKFLFFALLFASFSGISAEQTQTPPATYEEQFRVAQQQTENPIFDSSFIEEFIKMLIILGGIVLFLFLLLWLMKRVARSHVSDMNAQSRIRVIDHRPISAKTMVFVLEIEGESYIALESQSGVSLTKANHSIEKRSTEIAVR